MALIYFSVKVVKELLQEQILDYLQTYCSGRENAQTKNMIMKNLGISDERLFRECISQLRLDNEPILSSSGLEFPGYFLPANPEEAKDPLTELVSRQIELKKIYKGIQAGLKRLFPGAQMEFDFEDDVKENTA